MAFLPAAAFAVLSALALASGGCATASSDGQTPRGARPASGAPGASTARGASEDPAVAAGPAGAAGVARPLAYAASSPEDLARRALDLLAADDTTGLSSLRVRKDEFCSYLWAEFPGSKVPNVSCDFAWSQATLNSMAGFEEILAHHRGKRYELVSMRYQGGTTDYTTFRVFNKPVVTVRDETGREFETRLFGSILELDGQYKLFGYAVK